MYNAHTQTDTCTLPAAFCWKRAEQLCLINGLICRPFCSVLFSFNKVLLCYCYRRRENMKKRRKLLTRSTALTNHTSYCRVCVPLLLAEYVRASVCLPLCVKLLFLSSWGCFGSLAGASNGNLGSDWHSHGFSRWPFTQNALSALVLTFFHSLLNMLQLLPHGICVYVCVFL